MPRPSTKTVVPFLPRCPGCGTPNVELYQPVEGEPARLISVCTNDECRTIAVHDQRANGHWVIVVRCVAPPMSRRTTALPAPTMPRATTKRSARARAV
jgi:hypothetical protein